VAMKASQEKHIVIIEAYQGVLEYLTDEPEDLAAAQGIGLPLDELAGQLEARVTVLCWDEWLKYEQSPGSPFTWVSKPATRPISPRPFQETASVFISPRVRRISIPAKDPVFGRPFSEGGFSPQSYGLIANNDLMFFVSFCLRQHLTGLARRDPFHAVILPMWGGLGYLSQLSRATGAEPALDVPFVVVATDTSARRQAANQEGLWSLEATIRRQMEDLSLALADGTLAFGPRGESIISNGRLPEAAVPILAPRRVSDSVLDRIAGSEGQDTNLHAPAGYFLYEPQDPASGVLTALDAVALFRNRDADPIHPLITAGPPMIFAPMSPRSFQDYWGSKGFTVELERRKWWQWQREYPVPGGSGRIRLFPSLFEHLPNVWSELARGSLVLLSPAAAEGFAPGAALPGEILLKNEPTAEDLVRALESLSRYDLKKLEGIRRTLCHQVVACHRGDGRARRLEETVSGLEALLTKPVPQDLSRVSLMVLDRRRPLRDLASEGTPVQISPPHRPAKKPTLSVVVTCYEMGGLVRETVESIWSSDRRPEEVLLIDDGSQGEETLQSIAELEQAAAAQGLPLRVIRQENRGLARARNAGLKAAGGEFISFIDGDDRIEPRFYELAVPLLERHPVLGGVAAWATCFGEQGVTGFWNAPQPELPLLLVENGVIVPCLMRTGLLKELSGYDTDLRYNYEDWELSIRFLALGRPIITIPAYLLQYRERSNSLFRTMTDAQNQIMRERLFEKHRTVVTRFGLELAMLLENRLMRKSGPGAKTEAADPSAGTLLARAKSLAGLSVQRLRRQISTVRASSHRKKETS